MKERNIFLLMVGVFLAAFYIPLDNPRVTGAISVFVSQASVLNYFGAQANKILSYGVASISGTVLAVCSCTVLPLFAGIYTRGASIGPATAFLYAGPAINILAIILSARVLGMDIGIARAVGAVVFAIVIGLLMNLIFLKEEKEKEAAALTMPPPPEDKRSLGQYAIYFASMVFILIFAAWGKPTEPVGFFNAVYEIHCYLTIFFLVILAVMLKLWFERSEINDWLDSTWDFAKKIFPLLLGGVLVAGFLMGRPGLDSGIIPEQYVAQLV